MSETVLIRDVFNDQMVDEMAKNLLAVYPKFNSKAFKKHILPFDPNSSFKERGEIITNALIEYLPSDFIIAGKLLLESFGPENEKPEADGFTGFYYFPIGNYVAEKGCSQKDLSLSFELLKAITKRFTSEFPIRTFIENFPNETLKVMQDWVKDKNPHVRRLVSEGLRPRLPWAGQLKAYIANPTPILPYLNALRSDPELYVRRSVANCWNDIAKDHPQIVTQQLKQWFDSNNKNTQWIVRHALRSLIKQGNPDALEILGFGPAPSIEVSPLELSSKSIALGGVIEFNFTITNTGEKPIELMVDYNVFFMKANGQTKPKTFKIGVKKIAAGETITLAKKQDFKPISTRKYYAGKHGIAVQINGLTHPKVEFEVQ